MAQGEVPSEPPSHSEPPFPRIQNGTPTLKGRAPRTLHGWACHLTLAPKAKSWRLPRPCRPGGHRQRSRGCRSRGGYLGDEHRACGGAGCPASALHVPLPATPIPTSPPGFLGFQGVPWTPGLGRAPLGPGSPCRPHMSPSLRPMHELQPPPRGTSRSLGEPGLSSSSAARLPSLLRQQ